MLHAALCSLKGYSRTALPYMFWEIEDFQLNQDFPRSRKANSFRTTSNTENKTKALGKLHPRASAAPEQQEMQGQAVGWQALSGSGV